MDLRLLWWVFAAVGAFYLLTDHRPHLFDYLPYLLLMACPLMHLFHRHGGHGHRDETGDRHKDADAS